MNIFRLPHKHLNPETLAEYLDSRLSGTAMARVDQRLTSCATCREELDSLRTTVSLLKQLPEIVPTRNFTMAAPPPQPALLQPAPLFRVPQWAYAGAASAAALVLAVLISADTTGVLATRKPTVAQAAPAAVPLERFSAIQERSVTQETIQESEATPFEKPAAPSLAAPSVDRAVQAETAAMAPETRPQALGVEIASPDTPAAAAPLAPQALSPQAAGPREPVPAEADSGPSAQTTLDVESESAAPPPKASQEATGWAWRVLEGLAAAALVIFLAGMIIRRRWLRRSYWY